MAYFNKYQKYKKKYLALLNYQQEGGKLPMKPILIDKLGKISGISNIVYDDNLIFKIYHDPTASKLYLINNSKFPIQDQIKYIKTFIKNNKMKKGEYIKFNNSENGVKEMTNFIINFTKNMGGKAEKIHYGYIEKYNNMMNRITAVAEEDQNLILLK